MEGSDILLASREADFGAPALQDHRTLVHPYVVCRVAGLPLSSLLPLRAVSAYQLAVRLLALEPRAMEQATAACDALVLAIASADLSDSERRALIDLKRDLYNRRTAQAAGALEILRNLVPPRTAALADQAIEIASAHETLERMFVEAHGEDLSQGRAALRDTCLTSERFLKGLAFGAPTLAADLLGSASNAGKFAGKRGREMDGALFNFFMRASMKVSPLTWFAPIVVGRWTPERSEPLSMGDRKPVARTEVSRQRLANIRNAMTRSLRFWGETHPLQLNPTLSRVGDHYEFRDLHAKGGGSARTWGVDAPRVRLPRSERLDALVAIFGSRDGSLSLPDLTATLDIAQFGGQATRIAAFVEQAMRVGLLSPEAVVGEQEDVPSHLEGALRERLPEAAATLRTITEKVKRYGAAAHAERLLLEQELAGDYAELGAAVGAPRDPPSRSPLFYEDCVLDGERLPVSDPRVKAAVSDLHRLGAIFPLLDYNHVIQSVMGALFKRRYGSERLSADACVHAIAEEAQALARRLTPLPLAEQAQELAKISPNASALIAGKLSLLSELRQILATPADVALSDDFLIRHAGVVPAAVQARPTSYTIIGQTFGATEDGGMVINRFYSGHCTLMSRFMHDLGEDELGLISSYLADLASPDAQLVEVPGVFGFNANLHPPFVDTEIAITGRAPNRLDSRKLSLADLSVRYDDELDRLAFETRDGRPVSFHYFGFLNLMALPALYQLLGRAHGQGLILDIWQELLFTGLLDPSRRVALSRLTYGRVVLSRRSLYLPPSGLPSPAEPDASFYRTLVAKLNGEPAFDGGADSYVRLVPDRSDFTGGGEKGGKSIADTNEFKPAYLGATVPLSVAALRRKLARRSRGALFQEALPGPDAGGVELGGRHHACEIQLEIARIGLGG